jgi:hypothetical protein
MEITGNLLLTNGASAKTLTLRANGLTGTALGVSPSLASFSNYTFETAILGRGDGVSILGAGMLSSQTTAQGGMGVSGTSNPTLSRDYINQGTEFVLTATKATAGDTMQLEYLTVTLL